MSLKSLAFGFGCLSVYIIIMTILLSACSSNEHAERLERMQATSKVLSEGGEELGRLPDGRKVARYWVPVSSGFHAVYVVDNMTTTTSNSLVPGKPPRRVVTVTAIE